MTSLLIVAGQVAILFALMAVGFVCHRTKTITEKGIGEIVALLLLVVNPCLIVEAFNRRFDPTMMKGILIAFAFAMMTQIVMIALSQVLFRGGKIDSSIVLKVSATFSNAAFMGFPLEKAVLGNEGVFYGVAYVVAFNLLIWSWGYGLCANGRLAFSRKMILNPGLYGMLGGLCVFFLPFDLPQTVSCVISSIADMNTPLAMMVIGYYLAGAKFETVLRCRAAYGAIAFRLIFSPLLAIAGLWLLRHQLDRTLMLALVIPAAAPVAAMTSMFAAEFRRDVDLSAALVSATTLLSIVTMPLMVAFAIKIFG